MSLVNIHPDIQIDAVRVELPVRSHPKKDNSIWQAFFENLTIGASFTANSSKAGRIRTAFANYKAKHPVNCKIVARRVEGTNKHRFWLVENKPKLAAA